MNDRFKFRVWFNKLKRYSKNTDDLVLAEDGTLGAFDTVGCYSKDDVVIEQCTGLKDKNGKLIYEGDLIKSPNNSNLLEVIWEESSWHTKEYRPNGKNELILDSLVAFYGVEIVGNIHENPELLKESK